MVKPNNLRKVSIARLKQEMQDTVFLSDDLAITTIDYLRNPTSEIPARRVRGDDHDERVGGALHRYRDL